MIKTILMVICVLVVPALGGCNTEVYAVLTGYPVTYSTRDSSHDCTIFRLDIIDYALHHPKGQMISYLFIYLFIDYAFSAGINDKQQWVQVSSMNPENWIAVVTQGRPNVDQWISEYMVSYTNDGRSWTFVDNGRLFTGNTDRNTWIRNDFDKPVFARAIRIHPTKWVTHISFRFDAIFQRY